MKKQNKLLGLGLVGFGLFYYVYSTYELSNTAAQTVDNQVTNASEEQNNDLAAAEEAFNQKLPHLADLTKSSLPVYTVQENKAEFAAPVKRRKFISNKLWRDDAAPKLEIEDGAIVHVITLDDQTYEIELERKLIEEAAEVQTAVDKAELVSEVGDVYEVLDCIIAHKNLEKDAIIVSLPSSSAMKYHDKEYGITLGLLLLQQADKVKINADEAALIDAIKSVYEVLESIIAYHALSRHDIKKAQDKKRIDRGSYLKRQYVTYAEYLPNGFMVPYCLKQPDKYEEMFD